VLAGSTAGLAAGLISDHRLAASLIAGTAVAFAAEVALLRFQRSAWSRTATRHWPSLGTNENAELPRRHVKSATVARVPPSHGSDPGADGAAKSLAPAHLLCDSARQALAEQLYEQFVCGVDAVGVFERVEIQQKSAYHGERERR
jgi:hypothetical protein